MDAMGSDEDEAPKKKKVTRQMSRKITQNRSDQPSETGNIEFKDDQNSVGGANLEHVSTTQRPAAGGANDGDMETQIIRIVEKIVGQKVISLDEKFRYWHEEVN